jgi:hypothetical protein
MRDTKKHISLRPDFLIPFAREAAAGGDVVIDYELYFSPFLPLFFFFPPLFLLFFLSFLFFLLFKLVPHTTKKIATRGSTSLRVGVST